MSLRLLPLILLMTVTALSQTPPVEPGVSHELAKWRAVHYSDVRYKLKLTLEKMSPVVKGKMEIRVKVGARTSSSATPRNGETAPIILDWRKIKGNEPLSTISNVSLNGEAVQRRSVQAENSDEGVRAPFEEANEHLIFRDGVVIGENVIELDFTSPILTSGSAITRYVDKEDGAEYIYSLFVPSDASTAFPVFDQPDLKARFSLQIRTPASWKRIEISNAKAVSDDSTNGWVTTEFEDTKPISTYVFAFAVGDFARFGQLESGKVIYYDEVVKQNFGAREFFIGDEIEERIGKLRPDSIYLRRSQAEKFKPHAAEVFRLNREGIKYLENYFDYKFPFPKYDLVLIPEFPFGGMEHAGATFLREDRVIFPTEPTKNDHITRANLIFHEAAHQWFGDTVTMRWFDDLWLKEGFAEFMAYKTLEKVMPEYNAWKIFYERNKQAAYLTDSTKGTTPIYQEISNLNAAKSAYGNIVYRKAPSFLRQAEFYIGPDKFQTAVRAFLKKHEFGNAEWTDLVKEFELSSKNNLKDWANVWVKQPGLPQFRTKLIGRMAVVEQTGIWEEKFRSLAILAANQTAIIEIDFTNKSHTGIDLRGILNRQIDVSDDKVHALIPNYQDYGYGIFLLDDKSRDYVLKNIHNEKDDFLRTMMWGSLWDSVREAELAPEVYVDLVVKNLSIANAKSTTPSAAAATPPNQGGESDESTIQTLLGRVSTAMTYCLSDTQRNELAPKVEAVLIERMQSAPTPGQRITFYRAFLSIASTEDAKLKLKEILNFKFKISETKLKAKDKFDIVTKLLILGDKDAPKLLAELEKTETSDEAKRYAYAAKGGIASAESKAKFWADFTANKDISESWIESAFGPFNSPRHAELTLPYLEKALAELPNLKRSRKIFFVNGWLAAFIGGQRSEQALAIVNKFLADNPNLDKDLRLKILENVDLIERAVKIRGKYN